jgi:2-oxoglutarate ferredoxin oxidoreductase subunit alpha
LLFVIHAGAGEFPRAVYAPGTATEAYDLTRLALATAHEFQTPTLILTDQFMMDLRKNAPPLSRELRPVDRCLEESPSAAYVRYRLTENGVSPRAIPGGEAFVVVDSDEHTEDGRLTEDLEVRVRLQGKRMAKETGLRAQTVPPAWYGPEDAGLVLITWGSTYGPGREAIDLLNAEGPSAAMVHFSQVWPLDAEAIKARLGEGDRRLVCVEGNSTGQFGALLREVGVGVKCEPLLKYDGVQFTAAEIVEGVRR